MRRKAWRLEIEWQARGRADIAVPGMEENSQEKLERCPASKSLEWQCGAGSFALDEGQNWAFARSL